MAQFFPPLTDASLWLETERLDLPNQALWAMFDQVGAAGLSERVYLLSCKEKLNRLQIRVNAVRSQLGVRSHHPLHLTLQQMSLQILGEMRESHETISSILFRNLSGRVEIMHQLRKQFYSICFLVEEWRILLQKALGDGLAVYYN